MKQKRLEAICSYLNKEDKIIDIGCDHAYVCIEMAHRGANQILATDIHPNALQIAKENIKNSNLNHKISCKLSDGLEKIDATNYNTIVIAGMGASTIKHILKNQEKLTSIQKIVIQSNNELPKIRKYLNQIGYALKEEKIIKEKKHYYTIMKFQKGTQKLKKIELEFGIFQKENEEYYQFLFQKKQEVLNQIPKKKYFQRLKMKKKQKLLQKFYLKKSNN